MPEPPLDPHQPTLDGDPETTAALLARARQGDEQARDRLARRYEPIVKRLAHGRVPPGARGMIDTDDIVLITIGKALNHLDGFEPRRDGAFLAYLRCTMMNVIRDEARRANRRLVQDSLDDQQEGADRTPLELAIGREVLDDYEAALQSLTPEQREVVMLRLEFGMSYPQIAEALGRSSAGAARMMVARALVKLGERMAKHRESAT